MKFSRRWVTYGDKVEEVLSESLESWLGPGGIKHGDTADYIEQAVLSMSGFETRRDISGTLVLGLVV